MNHHRSDTKAGRAQRYRTNLRIERDNAALYGRCLVIHI